jgi:thioredoxin-related protein
MPPSEAGAPAAARSGPTRATPVLLLALAGALLVARVALGIVEHARPVERADRVEWREPAAGEAEARLTGRLLLYCFTRGGDPRCRQLTREVFADARAAERIQRRFVPIRVLDLAREDGHNPPDVARLEQEYAVNEFPTLVVATPGHERFEKQAGYAGALATTQFITGAPVQLLMGAPPGHPRAGRDSVAGGADTSAGGAAGR